MMIKEQISQKKLLGESVKKVFITGGAGFIGSHVVDSLMLQGYEVTVYDNLSNGHLSYIEPHLNKPNFKFIQADIIDFNKIAESMKGHDLIWHMASNTDIISSHKDPKRDLDNETIGTFNVLEAMRRNGIRDVLFPSSGAVYGDLCSEIDVSESSGPLLPNSTYGAGKLSCEAFISAYCYVYGLRAWIFRFGNVIGNKMTHGVIFDFIRKLKENPSELEILGDGTQEKNYFLVEECIDGMSFAYRNIKLNEDEPCKIFNLGTNSISRVVDIAKVVKEEMNLQKTNIKIQGSKKAWPGDQPKVHMKVDAIKNYGWSAKLSSDEAVKIAVRRLLGKND